MGNCEKAIKKQLRKFEELIPPKKNKEKINSNKIIKKLRNSFKKTKRSMQRGNHKKKRKEKKCFKFFKKKAIRKKKKKKFEKKKKKNAKTIVKIDCLMNKSEI